ncbi:MAG TPA: type II secretion system F family protein [Pyrinomonadaceae bacterium]|jgi:tight adherence protein C|nr:type II secretion system F family protein [Pyrinomonadaceae bacterium]
MILIITLSTFAFITLGVLGIYWLMFRPASAATERLRRMGETAGGGAAIRAGVGVDLSANAASDDGMTALAERMAKPLHRLAPPSAAEAKKLQKQLMQAGYRSPNAPIVYRAIQLIWLVALPGAVALGCALLARPLSSAILWILSAFIIGFFLPRYVLNKMVKRRQQRVRWGLADALDLMVVSIEAGLGLNAAIVKVGEELKEVHPEISEEFELTNLEIRVGRDRDEALRNLAERTGVDDLRSLVAMLIQADRFGTSIARAVRVYADSLRTKRRQRAEQAAQKAAVKLLFPLACFLFPTLFISILGPAALNLIDSFAKM